MNSKLLALIIMALGLFVSLLPWHIFPVCVPAGTALPMKCYWSGQLASGLGGLVSLVGLFMACTRSASLCAALGVMLAALGLLLMAVPVQLVGLCASPAMPCRQGTLPALCLSGGLLCVLGLLLFGLMKKRARPGWQA